MDDMIKKAIEALQGSNCNEIELTDLTGLKVRVVKYTPVPPYYYPWPYQFAFQPPYQL